jgi:hypothetical protein
MDTINYQGLTTNSPDGVFNAAPQDVQDLKTSGAGTELAAAIAGNKYKIDISGDVKKFEAPDYPLLTLVANAPSEKTPAPYFYWTDEYDSEAWVDIALDGLRLRSAFETGTFNLGGATGATSDIRPFALSNSSQTGGKLAFESITLPVASTSDAAFASAVELALDDSQHLTFGFSSTGKNIIGNVEFMARKLDNLLRNLGYESTVIEADSKTYYKLAYVSGAKAPAYFAFENISYTTDGGTTIENDTEVIARIEEFYFSNDLTEVIFKASMADSNIRAQWDGTASNNVVCLEEVASGTGTVFNSVASGTTRISRTVLIGKPVAAPAPIAEGERLNKSGGFFQHRERKGNYTQIFDTDMYGITGTALATQFKFGNGFKETRARYLRLFKAKQEAAGLWGIKYETAAVSEDGFVNGKPARATSGLMDYAMYPIKYFKTELPAYIGSSDTQGGIDFLKWINDLIAKAAAFRHKGARNLSFLVSRDFLNYISQQNALIGSHTAGNITGGIWTREKPSEMNFGLNIYKYESPDGTVNFVHEPMLDNTPSLPIPNFLFGEQVNPRKLMLSIDTANIRRRTLRGDSIEGNLQERDRDGFLEGMRGEHGFMVRFPKNNTLIYWG